MPELDYKSILWGVTVLMIVYGYGMYIRDILKWKTKPHLYSWVVFIIMASISFLIQYSDGAWPWSWALGASIVTTLTIAILAFFYGTKDITKSDTLSFSLALVSIILYTQVSNPIYALILVICITSLAFYPTFRKSYHKPNEETLVSYVFAWSRMLLSVFALYHFSILTIVYPLFISLVNVSLVVLILVRRKQLTK